MGFTTVEGLQWFVGVEITLRADYLEWVNKFRLKCQEEYHILKNNAYPGFSQSKFMDLAMSMILNNQMKSKKSLMTINVIYINLIY